MVFVFTSNRKKATYKTIFDQLKRDNPKWSPKQITLDFELAGVKAAQAAFPGVHIQCCYFHFVQSLIRNLGQNGLKKKYETDMTFAREIRKMAAVAFVPPNDVIECFEYLIRNSKTLNPAQQSKDANLKKFINDYFVNHYLGKPKNKGRGKPQFAIDLWNVHQSSMDGE